MRRWLAVLLLLLLPVQFSWAAMASYCAHEASGAAMVKPHPAGHHEHGGPSVDSAASQAADDGLATAQPDCGHSHCHGHVVGMLEAAARLPLHTPGTSPPVLAGIRQARHLPAQPERPQWARLA